MNNKEIYKIWAPNDVKWTDWVRPVPFIKPKYENYIYEYCNYNLPKINYLEQVANDTALFIDLPDCESVNEGVSLAKMGYRPIPLYNGSKEQANIMSTVDNHSIENALEWGAYLLKDIPLKKDAPPAFLLDSNRMHRYKMNPSVFDNSWDLYPQDIPSFKYFKDNGINKIIIRGLKLNNDLKKILYKYQQQNIKIYFTNGYDLPQEIKLKKPKEKDIL